MATVFTHPIVPIVARAIVGKDVISNKLLIVAVLATIIPDADVISFTFGISYADPFGHRGFTHSIAFSLCLGLLALLFARPLGSSQKACFLLVSLSCLSHALLDALTNGGLGVALLWPFTDSRYFLAVRPIEVSPIGANFISERGLLVLWSEFKLLWLPAILMLVPVWIFRRTKSRSADQD